ncbi:MAG: radical SAM protein [Cyclobacteriaceae bacterium]
MNKKKNSSIISGWKTTLVLMAIWLNICYLAFKIVGPNPSNLIHAIRRMLTLKKQFLGTRIRKLSKMGGRYFWDHHQAGWPSRAFNQDFKWIITQELYPEKRHPESVRYVLLMITKKCPLNCEHCFEWDEINKKETLSLDDLKTIVNKYQNLGTAQFLLGGGEPLSRYNELIELLEHASNTSDFWLSTSAFGLTKPKARALKTAGLTGLSISLDHYNPDDHNTFRGNHRSYEQVMNAIAIAHEVGLAVSLSVCTTRNFISPENLSAYADLALRKNVSFIQLIEPRAAGRYAGKDVQLSQSHYDVLDEFYDKLNNDPVYSHYPIVIHPGYYQRQFGCAGAGIRSITIDTDGNIIACPFCRKKSKSTKLNTSELLKEIQHEGCYKFDKRATTTLV